MKAVIVQVGEPNSIVLFNNGKIGAIPTPVGCQVGMVVSVKLNRSVKIIAVALAAVFLVAVGVVIGSGLRKTPVLEAIPLGSEHRRGRGHMMMERMRENQVISVEQALQSPDDTEVTLTGSIVRPLGDEKYLFRDPSGDIVIEIDRNVWRNLSDTDLSETDLSGTIEISGETEVERGQVEIDVKTLRKR